MIQITIHNVNNFAVYKMTKITALDLKSDSLLRTYSVATNLMTSLEFTPSLSATILCHPGQTSIGSVFIHFNLRSSTATSSATGNYVAVPKRLAKMKNRLVTMRNGLGKRPVWFPKVELAALILQTCNPDFSIFLCICFYIIVMSFIIFPYQRKTFSF